MVKAEKHNDEGLIMAWVLNHDGCYFPGTIEAATLTDTGSITFNVPDDVYEKGGLCTLATPMESVTKDSPIFMKPGKKPIQDLAIVTEAGNTLGYDIKMKKDPTAVNTAGVIDTVSLEGSEKGEFWYHKDNVNRVVTAYVSPNIIGDLTFKSLSADGNSSGITSVAAIYAGYNRMNHMLAANKDPNAAKNYVLNVHRLLQNDPNVSVMVPFINHEAHLFKGMIFDNYNKIWGNHKYNTSDIDMISSQPSGNEMFAVNAHGDKVACSTMSVVHATTSNTPQFVVGPGSVEDTGEDVESVACTVSVGPSTKNWFLKVHGHDPDKADSVVQVGQFKMIPNSDPPMMAMNWITIPTPSFIINKIRKEIKINKIRMRLLKADNLKPQIYVVCASGQKVWLGILDVSDPDKPSLSFQDSPFITDVSSTCIAMNNSGKVIISSSYEDGGKINYGVYQIKPAANLTLANASLLSNLEIVVPARFDAVALNNEDTFVAVYYKTDTNDKYIACGSIDDSGGLIFDAVDKSNPFIPIPGGGVIARTHANAQGASIVLDEQGYFTEFDSFFSKYTGNMFCLDGNQKAKYDPDSFGNELKLQPGTFMDPSLLFPADAKASPNGLAIGMRVGNSIQSALWGALTGVEVGRRIYRRIGPAAAVSTMIDVEMRQIQNIVTDAGGQLPLTDQAVVANLQKARADAAKANVQWELAKEEDPPDEHKVGFWGAEKAKADDEITKLLATLTEDQANMDAEQVAFAAVIEEGEAQEDAGENASDDLEASEAGEQVAKETIEESATVERYLTSAMAINIEVEIALLAVQIAIFNNTMYRTIRTGLIQPKEDTLNAN